MEDTWESSMMLGVGINDMRGIGDIQPSCSGQTMARELNHQTMQHHQELQPNPDVTQDMNSDIHQTINQQQDMGRDLNQDLHHHHHNDYFTNQGLILIFTNREIKQSGVGSLTGCNFRSKTKI
ncbi:hypothetical protein RI129_009007 [Pyrocoelia pectoralis]|uniref:Uncharacterized protein n=1 Tax=Pyrocoelia pectoralis TaxID=417401 RepID=A0AAN7V6M1_9COLE